MKELQQFRQSRRSFLAGAGAVGALGAATLMTGCNDSSTAVTPTPTPTPTPIDFADNDILNFALNLEYLEGEFYTRAATGTGIPSALALTGAGTVNGGGKVTGSTAFQSYLNSIAQDELNHIAAIQATLTANSGTPVPRPTIDFTAAFTAIAASAGLPASFNPFADPQSFLVGAAALTEVGITAYNGAAPMISSNTILDAAAGIVAAESYHAAAIRVQIAGNALATGDPTYENDLNSIIALKTKLGGTGETPLSISSIVSADPTNAIGFARTTDQVLHIVYGTAGSGAGVKSGGFFPNGLNGTLTTTKS